MYFGRILSTTTTSSSSSRSSSDGGGACVVVVVMRITGRASVKTRNHQNQENGGNQ